MSILICFFLALIPFAASITFNFTNITPEYSTDIRVFLGASVTDDGIQVTPENKRNDSDRLAGRASYMSPLHLWDNVTNDLASFSTSFTFVIDSYKDTLYGDGLTFFLAQNNSVINSGGSIGLPFDYTTQTRLYPFVAVEFDSYGSNEWDPLYPGTDKFMDDHVGININSLRSVAYRKWYTNIPNGEECRALISYYSDSKILSVSYTNFRNNSVTWETGLEYTIDLRDVLPELVIFGFSASTGGRFEKNNVRSWTFNSTELKVDDNNGLAPPPTTSGHVVKRKDDMLLKMGLIGGMLVLIIIFSIPAYFFWRRKKDVGDNVDELGLALEINNEFEKGASMPRRFSYHELACSTSGFADIEKLGEGSFGEVYKGFLKDLNIYIAVKRVSKTSNQGIKEYASEVRIISRLRHKNLVQLSGWCHEKGELLLAYEFMENGSLDLHLFKGKSLLTWNARYKIAHGLASALLYLHEEWEQCVLHRDIKSSNVMLDSNFSAKLGDFGLAKLVDHDKGSETTLVAGTIGYMAPEYVMTGKASKESDVFSFGVVALEVACGRKSIDPYAEERKTKLVEWVWDLYGTGTLLEASDPLLGSNFSEQEMTCLMIVGLWCAHPDSRLRPSMKQAIQVLNFEASIPILPPKMPYVTYPELPTSSSNGNTLSSGSNKHSAKLSTCSSATS